MPVLFVIITLEILNLTLDLYNMQEHRCPNCQHLLFKYQMILGQIEVKCYRCNYFEVLTNNIEVANINIEKLTYQGIFSFVN